MIPESQSPRGDALGSPQCRRSSPRDPEVVCRELFFAVVPTWLIRWATSRIVQKFRFHLIFGMRFGVFATLTNFMLIGWLSTTSSTLLRKCSSSLLVFIGPILVIPGFISSTLNGGMVIYSVLMLAQWFVVGFGISFFFRSRHWFFNSTFPFWLLFPLTFVPLILESSGTGLAFRSWCGFGLGQPWQWLYYCENYGATFFSVTAYFEDLSVGLAGVILVWQLAKFLFGQQPPP